MSLNEVVFEVSEIKRIVEKSDIEYFSAVLRKVKRTFDLFKDLIPLD
jgi:hypothetical protein